MKNWIIFFEITSFCVTRCSESTFHFSPHFHREKHKTWKLRIGPNWPPWRSSPTCIPGFLTRPYCAFTPGRAGLHTCTRNKFFICDGKPGCDVVLFIGLLLTSLFFQQLHIGKIFYVNELYNWWCHKQFFISWHCIVSSLCWVIFQGTL